MSTASLYPLGDAYMDGGIEERAWVPVAMAESPEAAIAVIEASDWSDTIDSLRFDGMRLIPTGTRSWHRIASCSGCDGAGVEARSAGDAFGPQEPCDMCGGSGEQEDHGDGIAWVKCEPDAPGAVEFWDLEVTES